MEDRTCKTCKHYRPHYVKRSHDYNKLTLGHCVYPRVKCRREETKACKHYKEKCEEK